MVDSRALAEHTSRGTSSQDRHQHTSVSEPVFIPVVGPERVRQDTYVRSHGYGPQPAGQRHITPSNLISSHPIQEACTESENDISRRTLEYCGFEIGAGGCILVLIRSTKGPRGTWILQTLRTERQEPGILRDTLQDLDGDNYGPQCVLQTCQEVRICDRCNAAYAICSMVRAREDGKPHGGNSFRFLYAAPLHLQ